jgi:anti-anti-sigma regulatory factor
VTELTLRYDIRGASTVVVVEGSVDARRCRTLRDGLEMACMLRGSGPIVVDLERVDRLAAVALLILRRATDEALRAGRTLTVRHLRQEAVDDPSSVRLLQSLWPDPLPGRAMVHIRSGRRTDHRGRRHRPVPV